MSNRMVSIIYIDLSRCYAIDLVMFCLAKLIEIIVIISGITDTESEAELREVSISDVDAANVATGGATSLAKRQFIVDLSRPEAQKTNSATQNINPPMPHTRP